MARTLVCRVYKHFENITDKRVVRSTNHELLEMIFVTLCAAICDANSWVDVERFARAKIGWLRKYIKLENGIPSHDTFSRVFARLDTDEFVRALQGWASDLANSLHDQSVAIDGKTLRGSFDSAANRSPLHSVSAWASEARVCLGVQSVEDKSNEIPAAQKLIDLLELAGAVVTADAMHCQKQTCRAIVDKEADYLIFVKENQHSLYEAIAETMCEAVENYSRRSTKTVEKNRARLETLITTVMKVPKGHLVFEQWPGLVTIGQVYRERVVNGKTSVECVQFITSRQPKVRELHSRVRSHWGIENSQHHVLDVTFTEDASRTRKGSGAEISSIFRRLALSILQRDTSIKDNIRGKRKRCGWDDAMFDRLLANM